MKTLIIEIDNETRAIIHELNRLKALTQEKRDYTENEKKIRIILNEKVSELIKSTGSFRELLKRFQQFDEFELGHGMDVGEIIRDNDESSRGGQVLNDDG